MEWLMRLEKTCSGKPCPACRQQCLCKPPAPGFLSGANPCAAGEAQGAALRGRTGMWGRRQLGKLPRPPGTRLAPLCRRLPGWGCLSH